MTQWPNFRMMCPKCGAEMRTTRSSPGVALQVRRRECVACHHGFFTEEKPAEVSVFLRVRSDIMRAFRARKSFRPAASPGME